MTIAVDLGRKATEKKNVYNSSLTYNDSDYCNNQLVCLRNCFCLKLEPYVDKICLKNHQDPVVGEV